ncbi:MAG TPA: UDP-N-acetylmuramoyl-L-alanine--D-glutamate ligase [candidate division Zixibacteria bacterium]|nr:UDP-N-acetylmuramoyl-L-alanine--D-glutamate ligase [candidate division Zixibacteria bacterium]MDD4917968.1 UDP-N-acetylmuramoyl-L-alanine--D-glutamate ligase [candidate division Zixibacteria bacterium]MDM7972480.1 UDP-N-acetylmuramoyl-L-alanine--D-glutamate ligase [candidate division Zixibacteria bacterium]HOD65265.1 UDP-N-acetylmuramoyl-L-alanine--D-glutamate ligase [candidate division Zixibacteria bacterium]HPC10954.1 UDP-N-acetylmuramoyl-L-alanine--D-glutamate ligase [candidate division Z
MTREERIRGRKVGVIGMARSGLAAALLAKEMGGIPFVTDSGRREALAPACAQLEKSGVPFETDGHSDRILQSDYAVISPGIPLSAEIARRIRERGIPLFSEIEFASWFCRGRIVAITGSNGKTTTTTLAGEMFAAAGRPTCICGNIGRPFAEAASSVPPDGVAVVEVSNFQLETIADFRPAVAAILNITADHLDRHGTMEEYKRTKYRITENQGPDDVLVTNLDDPVTSGERIATRAARVYFTTGDATEAGAFVRAGVLWRRKDRAEEPVIPARDILIPGPHNLQNAAAATVMATVFGVEAAVLAGVLRTFPGVEHRLERVPSVAGVHFINDSKATNVDSVCFALQSVDTPVYLILGGRDKGAPYEPLAPLARGKVRGVVAIGEAREKIFRALGREFPVQFADTLEEAVQKCFAQARPGETVLLSPACASFDMFDNYEHRGRAFKEAVAQLKNGKKNHNPVAP